MTNHTPGKFIHPVFCMAGLLLALSFSTACLLAGQVFGKDPLPPTIEATPLRSVTLPATTAQILPITTSLPIIVPTVQTGSLSGVVFFDRDANGLQTETEAGIPGVRVCLDQADNNLCTYSDVDGVYLLDAIASGQHSLSILVPDHAPDRAFRYLNLFESWQDIGDYFSAGMHVPAQRLPQTVLQPVEEAISVQVEITTRLDIGLSQGFLTDIFSCPDRRKITKFHGYDLDPTSGAVRNYLGDTSILNHTDQGPPGTEDNHHAVDWGGKYSSLVGLPVRAAAPGVVSFAGTYQTWQGVCMVVSVAHPATDGNITGYVHLDKILVRDRQTVLRGQIIGTLGSSCTTWPHVHFFLRNSDNQQVDRWEGVDPFRDTQDPTSLGWWTVDNHPVCVDD
jgi:murein DD-endopeptidase MepM/ murein hydrolase activator NlpD